MTTDDVIAELETHDLMELAQQVAQAHHVPVEEMLGPSRRKAQARARHALWYAMRHLGDRELSWWNIADMFGVDHTTVMSGSLSHARRLANGRPTAAKCTVGDGDARCGS